jgi:hypothetical protein
MLYDGQPYPENDFINYVPSSRAGCLAPHAWLHDGSSLYDHFGMGFTLLLSDQNSHPAAESLIIAAQELRIPLKVIHPTESAIGQLYPKRFTLIRPDQHVAWTGDEIANDAKVFLYKISGQH